LPKLLFRASVDHHDASSRRAARACRRYACVSLGLHPPPPRPIRASFASSRHHHALNARGRRGESSAPLLHFLNCFRTLLRPSPHLERSGIALTVQAERAQALVRRTVRPWASLSSDLHVQEETISWFRAENFPAAEFGTLWLAVAEGLLADLPESAPIIILARLHLDCNRCLLRYPGCSTQYRSSYYGCKPTLRRRPSPVHAHA